MSVVRITRAATVALCGLLVLAACSSRSSTPPPPNVLMILVDTLRADRLGSDGNTRGLTPFLDKLAAKCVVFKHAYAASSWTRPSVASLFTSRYPSQHGTVGVFAKLDERELTMAESLERLGYVGGAVSGSPLIAPWGGYGQGFSHFQNFPEIRDKVRADVVTKAALTWLDGEWQRGASRPAFLYLHLMEPHGPYMAPEPYTLRFARDAAAGQNPHAVNRKLMKAFTHFMSDGTSEGFKRFSPAEIAMLESLYDGEVASLDVQLQALFGELEQRGFLERAIVILTADHGEEFNDHGSTWHGYTLYNESIRVPLIMCAPGVAGRVVEHNVSLVDVPPTVLDLLGAPAPPGFEGHSFARYVRDAPSSADGKASQPFSFAELEQQTGLKVAPPRHARALIQESAKLLMQPGGDTEFYDLQQDPGEQHRNPPDDAAQSDQLEATLRQTQERVAQRAQPAAEQIEMDAATKDRLRALGYHVDSPADSAAPGAAAP